MTFLFGHGQSFGVSANPRNNHAIGGGVLLDYIGSYIYADIQELLIGILKDTANLTFEISMMSELLTILASLSSIVYTSDKAFSLLKSAKKTKILIHVVNPFLDMGPRRHVV